jgi:hypothetical protein
VPSLHLTKVAFACRDFETLRERVARRALDGEVRIPTRMRPRRAEELVGGNLYWVVKHTIVGGLEILRFEDRDDGRIDIVCSADLKTVSPVPRRAHQGWRYLEDKDAPKADDGGTGLADLPSQLYGRLAALALV